MISTARSSAPSSAAGPWLSMRAAAPANEDGPQRGQLAKLLVPLLIGNGLVVVLCMLGLHLLSGARAYVGGEGRWSKGHALAAL